ncbi:tapasin [Ornithorhynchus anatinus]|uniref:tapasin n=1 Tax=Ornithorhynchus anatinus TaxID=9258 RepID=UPI0010A943F6|nr:tapasin [Ornithorhynchus anatinus]
MAPPALLLLTAAAVAHLGRAEPLPCWLVREEGPGGGGAMARAVSKRPARLLLLREGQGPPTSDPQAPLLLYVRDPEGTLERSLEPPGSPGSRTPPACELSPYTPNPAAATWAEGLTPEPRCPRALDGTWLALSVAGPDLRLAALLRAASDPWDPDARLVGATAALTVATRRPEPRVRPGRAALLDLAFSCSPPGRPAAPPALGLEWRRQHRGAGRLLLAVTPGLGPAGGGRPAAEGALAFAGWDGPGRAAGTWRGNGTLLLPAVGPSQEGAYLAAVHLPYLQAQVTLRLLVLEPPKVSLSPSPLVLDPLDPRPAELRCLLARFHPADDVHVAWEIRGGPGGPRALGDGRADGGRAWLSGLRHHHDGTVSLAGYLRPPPARPAHHGARVLCRARHPALPPGGLAAEVVVRVAGLTGPSLDDGVGLFLTAFLLLGLLKALGWAAGSMDPGLPEDRQKAL